MKLTDLEAQFVRHSVSGKSVYKDAGFSGAEGVMFLCPLCFAKNRGAVGTHMVLCWYRGVDPSISPGPGRWDHSGTGIADLTLSPSVHLSGEGCSWHGWVKNGDAT